MGHTAIGRSVSLFCTVVLVLFLAPPALGAGTFRFDNDYFAHVVGRPHTDRWETGATRLSLRLNSEASFHMPWIPGEEPRHTLDGFLAHHLFTPENLSNSVLLVDDRPYAAWLHGGLEWSGLGMRGAGRYSGTTIGLSLGVIGPSAGGKDLQSCLHRLTESSLDSADPKGWDNQVEDEFALLVTALHQETVRLPADQAKLDVTFAPGFGLGTVMNYADVATMLRFSLCGALPPTQPYSPHGPTWNQAGRHRRLNCYLFAGVDGRYVFQNTFIEGNITRDSHGVPLEHWTSEAQLGLGIVVCRKLHITFRYRTRSKEFEHQPERHELGTLELSWL